VDPRPLTALILPVTIPMIYPLMVTLDVRSLVKQCHRRLLALVLLANLGLIPLLGWGLGRLFLPDEPYQAFGLLLMATLSTSGMTMLLLRLLSPLVVFYLVAYGGMTLVGRWLLPRDEALALAMTTLGPAGAGAAL